MTSARNSPVVLASFSQPLLLDGKEPRVHFHSFYYAPALIIIAILLCLGGVSELGFAGEASCELRGVWLNPPAFESEKKRDDILKKVRQSNLNTLFLLAPPIKNHRGWSTPGAFSAMLQEAKAQGLSAHAWIANLERIKGGADLTLPQEQAQQVQWALELLAQYPLLDGIHFDYLRFRKWDDVSREKVASVSKVVQTTFEAMKRQFPTKLLTAAVFEATPNYVNPQKEQIPDWFLAWMKANPKNPYASGGPYVPQGFKYQQDGISWLKGGFIDAIVPMEYTMDDARWRRNVQNWLSFRGGDAAGIYMGLGWLKEKGKPDWGYDAAGVVRKIKYARQAGIKGFVIFELSAFRDIDEALIDALTADSAANDFAAPFKNPHKSCLSK